MLVIVQSDNYFKMNFCVHYTDRRIFEIYKLKHTSNQTWRILYRTTQEVVNN